jgi:hypothetical protein
MEIEIVLIALATVGLIALVLAVFVSIRDKKVVSGVILIGWIILFSLLFSPYVGVAGLLRWYSQNMPNDTQIVFGRIALICGMLSLGSFAQIEAYRMKKIGNASPSGITGSSKTWRGVMRFLVLYSFLTMFSDLFYGANIDESIRRNIIWWVLAVCLLIHLFFSFEFREKGFVYRGKVILFSNIEHAEWENLRDKTKLKIRLKGVEPEPENQTLWKTIIGKINLRLRPNRGDNVLTIKTPWQMNVQIDNYLRANFPNNP